jgi:hypothetical protein
MNTSAFDYSVRLPFAAGPVSPGWLGARFLATLDALTQIDPNIFPDWEVGDLPAMKGYPLAVARSRIADIIDHNVSLDDAGQPEPESDYAAVAHTTIDARSLRMTVWANHWNVWLKAGDEMVPPDPAIVTYPLFRAALLAINAIWQQQWACVQAFRWNYAMVPVHGGTGGYSFEDRPMLPQDPTFPYSIFHIPWIAYLSAALATGVQLAPEIATERTADGGLLMTATKDRLDPDNSEHARCARIIAETMIAATGYQPSAKRAM